jgi:hypothetical protein
MQLKIKDYLQQDIIPEATRTVGKEDLPKIMGEINRRHTLPITPVTHILLYKYLEFWYKRPFIVLKKRVDTLNKLSLRTDISHKREMIEFFAVAYLYFFRLGVPFTFTENEREG